MRQARLLRSVIVAALVFSAPALFAQDKNSILKPPKGSKLALVVFEDMQCPQCARVHPQVTEASKSYNIPVVTYDFPLNQHPWAFDAAVIARYYSTKDKKLGDDFRTYIFLHQVEITKDNLRSFADRFGAGHQAPLPFAIDPQGKLAGEVKADRDLGMRVGIQHTPTVYVVAERKAGPPYVEVTDPRQLFETIDEVKRTVQ